MTEKCPLCKCSPCKCSEETKPQLNKILIDALQEIAATEPEEKEVNYSESIGWIENCTTCEEMIDIAKKALKKYKRDE